MSFLRLIYWSSLIGGWSAFAGWLVSEVLFGGRWIEENDKLAFLMAILVAIPIGGGISLAAGLGNPHWSTLVKRALIGCAGGFAGGLLGTLLGMAIFSVLSAPSWVRVIGRVLGWSLIGIGIGAGLGVMDGLYERSWRRMRNGLIGGSVGGCLGGLLFDPIYSIIASPISSRAFAFVLLGLSIGLFVGLVQVVLKEAWLTVEAGFRPGRQLIVDRELVTMGTSEKADLIFIAYGAKGVEPMHVRITKQQDGGYVLVDNGTRTGTLLNGQRVTGPMPLRDGDAIEFGVNVVRFRERVKRMDAAQPLARPAIVPPREVPAPPPLPPVVKPAPIPGLALRAAPVKPALGVPVSPPVAKPAPVPSAAAMPRMEEGTCPICDKKVVGIPGKRRCSACFATF